MYAGRVRIGRGVGMAVVGAVVRGPPQWPALHAGRPDHREHELHRARGTEGAVREVTVVEGGDGEHAHGVQRHGHAHRHPRHPHPDHRQAGQVHRRERDRTQPVHAVPAPGRDRAVGAGIEPAPQRGPGATAGGAGCSCGGSCRHNAHLLACLSGDTGARPIRMHGSGNKVHVTRWRCRPWR
ncbi:hypothetical protein D3C71_1504240 [compost metagenome]